jgi:hypothetical protein
LPQQKKKETKRSSFSQTIPCNFFYYTTLARVTPHSVKVDESTSDYRLKEFDGSKKSSWRENSGHMFFVSQLAISEERSTFLVLFWALQARLSAQGRGPLLR